MPLATAHRVGPWRESAPEAAGEYGRNKIQVRQTARRGLTAAATLDSRQCECERPRVARETCQLLGAVPRALSTGEERQGIVDGTCFPVATAHRVGTDV